MEFEIIAFLQNHDSEGTMCCMYAPIPGTGTAEKLAQLHKNKLTGST